MERGIDMPIVGATQLEPVNILGSYIQGLEGGRAARAQRMQEAAAMAQAQREAELRNYLATADLSQPEAQNQLLRYGKSGAEIAKAIGEMATQTLTREKTQLDIKKAERDARLEATGRLAAMLRGALKNPADYPSLLRMAESQGYDISEAPRAFDASWLNSKLAETLGLAKILEFENQQAQAQRDVERLGLERERVGISRASEARQAAESADRSIVARSETDAAGNVTFYNKFGEKIRTERGAGKPSGAFEKSKIAREETQRNITEALSNLREIVKPGGLIEKSTGSGLGRARDVTAGFFGKATEGAIAAGQLAPLADQVLKLVPRFEGPQSDKDTQSYREAAGQLADSTLPNEIRKAAANTIIKLFERRQNQFTMQGAELESSPSIDALLDKYK